MTIMYKMVSIAQSHQPAVSVLFRVFVHNIDNIQTDQPNAEYLFVAHIPSVR